MERKEEWCERSQLVIVWKRRMWSDDSLVFSFEGGLVFKWKVKYIPAVKKWRRGSMINYVSCFQIQGTPQFQGRSTRAMEKKCIFSRRRAFHFFFFSFTLLPTLFILSSSFSLPFLNPFFSSILLSCLYWLSQCLIIMEWIRFPPLLFCLKNTYNSPSFTSCLLPLYSSNSSFFSQHSYNNYNTSNINVWLSDIHYGSRRTLRYPTKWNRSVAGDLYGRLPSGDE